VAAGAEYRGHACRVERGTAPRRSRPVERFHDPPLHTVRLAKLGDEVIEDALKKPCKPIRRHIEFRGNRRPVARGKPGETSSQRGGNLPQLAFNRGAAMKQLVAQQQLVFEAAQSRLGERRWRRRRVLSAFAVSPVALGTAHRSAQNWRTAWTVHGGPDLHGARYRGSEA
jgi:hypothetical protein